MKATAAIALLALRHALRSRVILVLAALLFAAAFLLPLAIRSDGTPAGLIRLHLAYTLGIATFLLTLASLWAGCAAIAQEADEKTLQLLLVKPVARFRIWLGKWLALLLINAVLLAVVGAAGLATLRWQLARGGFDPADLAQAKLTTLAALETVRAPLPDIEPDVRAEYEALRAGGQLPEGAAESVVLDSIRRTQLARRYSIPPGGARTWTFAVPPFAPKREPSFRIGVPADIRDPRIVHVQFKCDSSIPGAAEYHAALDVEAGPLQTTTEVRAMPGTIQDILVRSYPADAREARATFRNAGTHNATLFFDPADGLVLRREAGTFAGNYVRALLQLYLRLALFSAIGVTLGTLFSLPVASFLALVLVLILQLSGFISAAAQVDRETFVANVAPFGGGGHHHGEAAAPEEPGLAARAAATVFYWTYRATWLALNPLLADRTLDDLASGTWLPPRRLARNALQQGLLLPLVLALVSTYVLKKREWALPQIN